ncbi:putative ATP-dependent transcriptional regulator,MalT-like, LuxR family [Nostocoides japonicum T1-X7]|uniref:Putative ATP-dependent transcriptional regulator,MalT-like, LuxR family n=1 Tax=Nostocoides japonicum T1-X7 TaxID=1194083 RepID=A0A077M4D5_9MICO|nr:LuxR C-terminal-related transcriptional regulator [Tetrasphaera japonica]CCH79962.1 putative ATP-dependent transcriptional regulator,MalT-like, LuxR family [Tetrasphaera japonica T1-X7]
MPSTSVSTASSAAWTRHRPAAAATGHLPRPRLTTLLDDTVARHRVCVVAAPGGYGKTSAVGDWARTHAGRVAWLSLSPFDSEPRRLATGIVAALQSVARTVDGEDAVDLLALDPDGRAPAETFHAMGQALDLLEEPLVLVVDDAHRAAGSLAEGLLGALVDSGPEQLRLVLVGRPSLEVALSRQLLAHPDARIGAPSLAFDSREVIALQAVTRGALPPRTVLDETGGWPIAVRLVLMGGHRPTGEHGDDLLHHYVRDHILDALPGDLRRFVLLTASCGDVSADLAAAVSGRPDAGALLDECIRLGLFVERFDTGRRTAYRWHPVFARQCRAILRAQDPVRLDEVHRLAALHLQDDDPLGAIAHWIDAGAFEHAVSTALARWLGIVVGPDASALDRLCASLPPPYADDPRILLIRACAQDVIGEHQVATMLFAQAEARAAAGDTPPTGYDLLLALSHLFLLDDRADIAEASATVLGQASRLPSSFGRDRAATFYLLGWAQMRLRRDPRLLIELLGVALREAEAAGDVDLVVRTRNHLALSSAWAGRLAEARRQLLVLADEAPDGSTPWTYYAGGSAALAAGFVAYWSDDLAEAELQFFRTIRGGSGPESLGGIARFLLCLTAAASGEASAMRRAAVELEAIPRSESYGWSWPAFRQTAVAALEEARGHRDRAVAIARRAAPASTTLPFVCVVLAGILQRAGDLPAASRTLREGLRHQADISYLRVAALSTAALAHRDDGDARRCHELCEEALDLAVAEGVRRSFRTQDPALRRLLTEHVAWGTRHEEFVAGCFVPRGPRSVLDTLSERERAVLEQLRTTRTALEIAGVLGVSINTVKSHQRAIYRKLGVASRREAIRLLS